MSGDRKKKMSGGYSGSGRRQPMSQRCPVRVTYMRNKNAGQWKAHGYYLARERATEKRERNAAGFTRSERGVDIPQRLDGWQQAGDERLFKIIVSPEFGDRINLENHTRQLMARMERDIKTALELKGSSAITNELLAEVSVVSLATHPRPKYLLLTGHLV